MGNGKILTHPNVADATSFDLHAQSVSFWPSIFGVYNLCVNVEEMTNIACITVGGSFSDFGYDIRLQSTKKHVSSTPDIGFRVVVTWIEN